VGVTAVMVTLFFVRGTAHESDFSVFYAAGKIAARGDFSALYDYDAMRAEQGRDPLPFPYSATVASMLIPLSWLSFRTAYGALLLVNTAAAVIVAVLAWRIADAPRAQKAIVLSFVGVSMGLYSALLNGQFDIILTCCLLGVASLELRGSRRSVLAALPLVLKPQFLPGIMLYWTRERRWPAIAIVLATLAASYLWAATPVGLYRGFLGGNDRYNTFHSSYWALTAAPVIAGVGLLLWRTRDVKYIFVLPFVVTWGPRDIVLTGYWMLLISQHQLRTEQVALWGMLLVAASTAHEVLPAVGLLAIVVVIVAENGYLRRLPNSLPGSA